MTVTLPDYQYADAPAQRRFFESATERVQRVSGVRSAAFVNVLPFSTYNRGTRYVIEGAPLPELGREPAADFRVITPDYFATLGIKVLAGRSFDSRDRETGMPVAIVNRAFARRAFAGESVVGRRVRLGGRDSTSPWLTIIGVVGDVRHSSVTTAPVPEIYRPAGQRAEASMMLAARTDGDALARLDAIRSAISNVDPTQPVYQVKTLQRLVDEALLPNASAMTLMAVFGMLALALASVGTCSVVSYAVTQQFSGVRCATGARHGRGRHSWSRVPQKPTLVAAGAAIGISGAVVVTRLMAGVLYGVTPLDPSTYATVAGGLVLIGALACYAPARRAMRVDPVEILRAE